ncbi:hypothetical protein RchiOBHm_Chr4g0404501 [Rosa chinensis]|uniref:Uncharacterized protein n=1 Tax=Rosa chinensis TaxID=74649 RepID=A0A2P6QTX5_ROSCH|nr:hypothetical protein RchiOBHm_Chr4g0404501 [Rosa chinensis]
MTYEILPITIGFIWISWITGFFLASKALRFRTLRYHLLLESETPNRTIPNSKAKQGS